MKQGGMRYSSSTRVDVAKLLAGNERRILDVGCNDGSFGSSLKALNPEMTVVGIEADAEQWAKAADVLDQAVLGTFPQVLGELEGRFDAITFNHVVEHLEDPWSALRQCSRLLNRGGRILGEVPNIRFIGTVSNLVVKGDWTYTDLGHLDRTHLRFFTRSSLRNLLVESGFKVLTVHGTSAAWSARHPRLSPIATRLLGDFSYGNLAFVAVPSDGGPSRQPG